MNQLTNRIRTCVWISRNLCKKASSTCNNRSQSTNQKAKFDFNADSRTLKDFIKSDSTKNFSHDKIDLKIDHAPYVPISISEGKGKKVYFETYGCAMNVNDTEIARSVLISSGFMETMDAEQADVVLLMTCAIREGAEDKIWRRIEQLKLRKITRQRKLMNKSMKIGILGCMAERLKQKILEKEPAIDIVAGPDSYRHLAQLLTETEGGQTAVNVALSLDETYADITPVRVNNNSVTALVSIMRGCDNMCTYCIVPFTRGRERSRPIDSIVEEVKKLSAQGVKEITLLGQNVNSYRDTSESVHFGGLPSAPGISDDHRVVGFSTVYKPKVGGRRFADLLEKVSDVDPEMRVRFTSPHPKDFPDPVLQLIKERANICNKIHMPAQSGNNAVLESMGRGYTREAYMDLVLRIRRIVPDAFITSDFIAGFCGETEEAHKESLSLIREVGYSVCYTYPYSMREKTKAHRKLMDDVDLETKKRRSVELHTVFREVATNLHKQLIGSQQLVLVENLSKRSSDFLMGRTDNAVKTHFRKVDVPFLSEGGDTCLTETTGGNWRVPQLGDYVVVEIEEATSESLRGKALFRTNLADYQRHY